MVHLGEAGYGVLKHLAVSLQAEDKLAFLDVERRLENGIEVDV